MAGPLSACLVFRTRDRLSGGARHAPRFLAGGHLGQFASNVWTCVVSQVQRLVTRSPAPGRSSTVIGEAIIAGLAGWSASTERGSYVQCPRKASSQDNAACEGFFGRLKTEFSYPCDWRAFTLAQFIDAVDAYIHWYNETRIKLSLGGRSPIEYRRSLGLMP